VDLDARHLVHLLDGAGGADLLVLEALRRVADPGLLEGRRTGPGDDDGEVLLVAEVRLGVEVDLPSHFQAVLCRLHGHLDGDLLADLLAGRDGCQRVVVSPAHHARAPGDEDASCEATEHGFFLSYRRRAGSPRRPPHPWPSSQAVYSLRERYIQNNITVA